MKPLRNKLILITFLFLFLTGCKKNYLISEKQSIFFEFEYINYAWGYQHHGFLIDKDGNVLTYKNPESWNFPDNDFTLTENQVAENIASCVNSGNKISKEELNKYSNYIRNISSTKVTALKNVSADAGSTKYICYQFSENTGIYKGYIIKQDGDFTCENLNFYSKKVASWMKDIYNTVSRK
jgi:hypothetical protein